MPAVLAVDLGGTSMRGAVVAHDGRTAHREAVPTPAAGGEAVAGSLADLISRLRSHALRSGLNPVAAGVVTPGIVDEESGTVRYASNLGWRDMPLARRLRERIRLPVAIGHDVRAAALAEHLLGRAVGVQDFVHIAIGTGVAAGIYQAGAAVHGASTSTGEIGHVPVIPDGEPCTCGQRGCLEAYMSGAGLARRYRAKTGDRLTAQQIVARLGADPAADHVWATAIRALSLGLATLTLLLDPALIVLAGGVARAGGTLTSAARHATADQLAWREPPRIETTALGSDAGIIGAAAIGFRTAGLDALIDNWHGTIATPDPDRRTGRTSSRS